MNPTAMEISLTFQGLTALHGPGAHLQQSCYMLNDNMGRRPGLESWVKSS
jgi:hypothetical protein